MAPFSRAAFSAALVAASLCAAATAAPAPPNPTDPFGDPLPPGAVARLGTPRLRHTCFGLAFSPDGQTLASAGADGAVRLWDAASGKEHRRCVGLPNVSLRAMAYFPDGKTLVSKANETTIRLWDPATGREVRTLFPAQWQVAALAPGAEEGTLLELSADATLHVWDLTTGKEIRAAALSPGKQPAHLAIAPGGARVAGWSPPDVLTVWDASTGKEAFHTDTKLTYMTSLTFSPDDKVLAASGPPGQVVTWDVESGKQLRRYEDAGVLQWLTFAPDGKSVAGLGAGPAIHLWDLTSGKEIRKFEPPAQFGPSWWGAGALAISPDGKTLAAAQGAAIHLWDMETGKALHRFAGHVGPIQDVRFSADGRRVVTCGGDDTARLWELSLAKEVASWANTHGSPYSMVAAPDGKSVLATSPGGWLRVELGDEKPRETSLPGGAPAMQWVSHFILSGDGKALLGTGSDLKIYLWDAETGKEIALPPLAPKPFGAAAVSPDGKLLAEGGGSEPIRLWDLAAGKELRQVGDPLAPGQFRQTAGMAFSPDGRTLLHVGTGELTLHEVATGRDRMRMVRPNGPIGISPLHPDGALTRGVFSPDGETLAEGTTAGPVLLLDARTGRELARLTGLANAVTALAFSPDGKALAAGCVDGLALVWDVKEWTGRPRPSAELKPKKLSALWENLHDADAGKAYEAILALASSPKAAGTFLKERLTAGGDPRAAPLIRSLNDDDPEVRDKAEKELAKLGGAAAPDLRRALDADPPPESRRRLQELLDRYKGGGVLEDVRALRALEALERSGAPEAADALRALTKEAPDAAVKRDAAAALGRLAARMAAP